MALSRYSELHALQVVSDFWLDYNSNTPLNNELLGLTACVYRMATKDF